MRTVRAICVAAAFAVASPVFPGVVFADVVDPTTEATAISDRLRELSLVLDNPAIGLISDQLLALSDGFPAATTPEQEAAYTHLAEIRMQLEGAVDTLLNESSGLRVGKRTRSLGIPEPGPSPLYPGPCPDTVTRFALLTVAHVAEGIFEATKGGCEQQLPASPNFAFLCIALDVTRVAARIAYDQVDLCTVMEDVIFGEVAVQQVDHMHNDHNAHVTAFNSDASTLTATNTQNETNHTSRTNSLRSAMDSYGVYLSHRANTIEATVDGIRNRIVARGTQARERVHRRAIEQSLANYQSNPLGSLILPAANGGQLELVEQVVSETIVNATAAGVSVGTARTLFAQGQTARRARKYKVAFAYFQRAYAQALPTR